MAKFKEGDEVYYICGAGFRDDLVIASIQAGIVKCFLVDDKYLMRDGHIRAESHIFWTHDEALPTLFATMDKKIHHLNELVRTFIDYKVGIQHSMDGCEKQGGDGA